MDVLNSFVDVGNVLSSAYLIDEDGNRIDLPVDAFDGLPVANSLRKLTKEYQQLLGALQWRYTEIYVDYFLDSNKNHVDEKVSAPLKVS